MGHRMNQKGMAPLIIVAIIVVAVVAGIGIYVITRGGENQPSGGRAHSHDPIYIQSDDNFTAANGVVGGSGTQSDPYIIENWAISAENTDGIWIRNTTAYFIVRNCLMGSRHYNGIYLDNVKNGRIENNTCENNWYDIVLFSSSYNNLTSNTCSGINEGIDLIFSSYNNLTSNTCENKYWGIHMDNSSYNNLTGNTCENNYYGIWLYSSSNNNLTNNTCENDKYGIYLWYSSDNNTMIGNNLLNNSIGPYYDNGTNNQWS